MTIFLSTILYLIAIASVGFCIYGIYQLIGLASSAPYVASGRDAQERMFKLADIRPGMHVAELGSGTGSVSLAVAKRGAAVWAIELNPILHCLAKLRAAVAHITPQPTFVCGSFWTTPIPPDTNVVLLYLLPPVMAKLWKKLTTELKPGTIIISHAFRFPNQPIEAQDGSVFRYRLK